MNNDRAAELIAMLTAKVHSWEPAIRAFDGIRREDVALSLSLINVPAARLIARIKYADQRKLAPDFVDQLLVAIKSGALLGIANSVALKAPYRWRYPRNDFLRDMCLMALCETLSPKLCHRCKGHGFFMQRKGKDSPDYIRRNCDRCGGNGKRLGDGHYEERERAYLMGIKDDAWCHTWRDRYRAILTKVESYEQQALGGMAKRFNAA